MDKKEGVRKAEKVGMGSRFEEKGEQVIFYERGSAKQFQELLLQLRPIECDDQKYIKLIREAIPPTREMEIAISYASPLKLVGARLL